MLSSLHPVILIERPYRQAVLFLEWQSYQPNISSFSSLSLRKLREILKSADEHDIIILAGFPHDNRRVLKK